jgi:hypothetical protein
LSLDGLSDRNESIKILASPASKRNAEWQCHVDCVPSLAGGLKRCGTRAKGFCGVHAFCTGDGLLAKHQVGFDIASHAIDAASMQWVGLTLQGLLAQEANQFRSGVN